MVSRHEGSNVEIVSTDYERLLDEEEMRQTDSFVRPAKEILKHFEITRGVNAFLTSELPPYSGVGAIGGCNLSLVWALATLQGLPVSRNEAAGIADTAEVNRTALPWGGADLYAQAIGGLTTADITADGVCATPVEVPKGMLEKVGERMMLFFTGRLQRDLQSVQEVAHAAERNRAVVIDALHEIKATSIDLRNALVSADVDAVGLCLDRTWQATRRLSRDMADPWVDQWYDMARHAGASGGKLNGLAGPGFLLLYCEPDRQASVTDSLESAGLRRIDFGLEERGVDLLLDESAAVPLLSKLSRPGRGNTKY